ncbi:hypothetical protein Hypma_012402 [Hypsizygus marmoreus]|uniref:Uncharacterized protein n=1 Tax=Hypsizygus marmoreus TaxID=39966 RepID=A0A369JEF1_HYPMA|nr:hypothetical protein Hypma_012402 [Hypsizygus marmoreus]
MISTTQPASPSPQVLKTLEKEMVKEGKSEEARLHRAMRDLSSTEKQEGKAQKAVRKAENVLSKLQRKEVSASADMNKYTDKHDVAVAHLHAGERDAQTKKEENIRLQTDLDLKKTQVQDAIKDQQANIQGRETKLADWREGASDHSLHRNGTAGSETGSGFGAAAAGGAAGGAAGATGAAISGGGPAQTAEPMATGGTTQYRDNTGGVGQQPGDVGQQTMTGGGPVQTQTGAAGQNTAYRGSEQTPGGGGDQSFGGQNTQQGRSGSVDERGYRQGGDQSLGGLSHQQGRGGSVDEGGYRQGGDQSGGGFASQQGRSGSVGEGGYRQGGDQSFGGSTNPQYRSGAVDEGGYPRDVGNTGRQQEFGGRGGDVGNRDVPYPEERVGGGTGGATGAGGPGQGAGGIGGGYAGDRAAVGGREDTQGGTMGYGQSAVRGKDVERDPGQVADRGAGGGGVAQQQQGGGGQGGGAYGRSVPGGYNEGEGTNERY